MKAAYYRGDQTIAVGPCQIEEPGSGQVRIEVAYCGVCGTDMHIFLGHMDQRLAMPQVIGHEMSGTIVQVGPDVADWHSGDRVVVRPIDSCGQCAACRRGHGHICQNLNFIGIDTPGAFQTSWTVPAHTLHRLPADLPLDRAALIEPLAVACHDVRLAQVQRGDFAVVIGGGPIGMLNALVAQQAGARVVVSEVNPFRLDFARSVGLEAFDPSSGDLPAFVEEQTEGGGADVVFEVSGSKAGAEVMTKLVRTRGRIVVVAIFAEPPQVDLFQFFWRELQLIGVRVYEPEDYEQAIALVQQGKLPLDQLITRRDSLEGLQGVFEEIGAGADIMKVLIDTQQ
ncbi:MAG: alcohol dehydrogenase catalytic domain-containing protein [Candidatus Latescibacteria bacterium]|nr:alcohol dehydrogenase catalytic domain-containing protein [Candidatus Latescibacterota bacterium]